MQSAVAGGSGEVAFVSALHKSGSSLLGSLLRSLAADERLCFDEVVPNARASPRFCPDASAARLSFWRHTAKEHDGPDSFAPGRRAPPPIRGEGCRAVFHIRHPADLVVSMFNSFTRTHKVPAVLSEPQSARELARRSSLRATGVDRYALVHWDTVARRMSAMLRSQEDLERRRACATLVSRYEDMVARPSSWARGLLGFLGVHNRTSRRRFTERLHAELAAATPDPRTHRAYVFPGAYRKILRNSTVLALLHASSDELVRGSGYF